LPTRSGVSEPLATVQGRVIRPTEGSGPRAAVSPAPSTRPGGRPAVRATARRRPRPALPACRVRPAGRSLS
jgi:hypothetical protein